MGQFLEDLELRRAHIVAPLYFIILTIIFKNDKKSTGSVVILELETDLDQTTCICLGGEECKSVDGILFDVYHMFAL